MNGVLQMVAVAEDALLAVLSRHPRIGTRMVAIAVPPALLSQRSTPVRAAAPDEPHRGISTAPRRITYSLFGHLQQMDTAMEAVERILRELGRRDPSFFDRLSDRVSGRTVRHLARSPEAVHPGRPDLRDRVVEVVPGWFLNTNISNRQKKQILQAACEVAGIRWGRDLEIDLPNA